MLYELSGQTVVFKVVLCSAPQKLEGRWVSGHKVTSGELDTDAKRQKLLEAYSEELLMKFPEWENLQVSLVAGAGFEPAAFRL